jgi:hypothetical protein
MIGRIRRSSDMSLSLDHCAEEHDDLRLHGVAAAPGDALTFTAALLREKMDGLST